MTNLSKADADTVTGTQALDRTLINGIAWTAVLRWVQHDQVARAWYQRKVERDGGRKMAALGALMRKLAKALYHVGRGEALDMHKLFDCERLGIVAASNTQSITAPDAMEVAM